jgi:hypothetical protein
MPDLAKLKFMLSTSLVELTVVVCTPSRYPLSEAVTVYCPGRMLELMTYCPFEAVLPEEPGTRKELGSATTEAPFRLYVEADSTGDTGDRKSCATRAAIMRTYKALDFNLCRLRLKSTI